MEKAKCNINEVIFLNSKENRDEQFDISEGYGVILVDTDRSSKAEEQPVGQSDMSDDSSDVIFVDRNVSKRQCDQRCTTSMDSDSDEHHQDENGRSASREMDLLEEQLDSSEGKKKDINIEA